MIFEVLAFSEIIEVVAQPRLPPRQVPCIEHEDDPHQRIGYKQELVIRISHKTSHHAGHRSHV